MRPRSVLACALLSLAACGSAGGGATDAAPAASGLPPPDALDFFGFWRWLDALTDAAWYGTNRIHALGDTPEQRFMGTRSDGVPVLEALVTDAP